MRRKSHATDLSSEEVVKDIRRATRKRYSAEEKIRIVLDGLQRAKQASRAQNVRDGRKARVGLIIELIACEIPFTRNDEAVLACHRSSDAAYSARSRNVHEPNTCGGRWSRLGDRPADHG
jgi:hypothetical protein